MSRWIPLRFWQSRVRSQLVWEIVVEQNPQGVGCTRNRLTVHYTPKHGSWLNVAEMELSVLARQCLDRRIPDLETLRREVAAWEQKRNAAVVKVDWQFTTTDARVKLKRLYPTIELQ